MKYNVRLRVETCTAIYNDLYTVKAGNEKAAETLAAEEAIFKYGMKEIIEIKAEGVEACA